MFGRWLETKKAARHGAGKTQPPVPTVTKSRNSAKIGRDIEQKASGWLKAQGLQLLQKNYCCRLGEIDLVMLDGQQLVFVEVRYRRHIGYGGATASVDRRKQRKLCRAAAYFLACNPTLAQRRCRFDVIAAQGKANSATIHWTWIRNAFSEH